MSEIEIGGARYRTTRMNVFDQAHVARKVTPILFSMGKSYATAMQANGATEDDQGIMFQAMAPIAEVLAKMSDEDVDYVLKKCLSACQKFNGNTWVPLMRGGNLMFDDIDLTVLMQLTMEVVQDNLGPSMRALLGQSSDQPETGSLSPM